MEQQENKPIRSSSILMGNYAHPATIAGGAIGAFVGSEAADKLLPRLDTTTLETILVKRRWLRPNVTETKLVTHLELNRIIKNLGRNLLRGGGAALGVGLTAAAVKSFRDREKTASFDAGENFANAQMNVLQQTHALTALHGNQLIKKFKQPTTVGIHSPIAEVGWLLS